MRWNRVDGSIKLYRFLYSQSTTYMGKKDAFRTNNTQKASKSAARQGRVVLCMLKTNIHDHEVFRIKLNELRTLVETLGFEVVGEFVQIEQRPSARFHIGSGKVKEIGRFVEKNKVVLVVFYNLLRSSQKLNLIRALRTDV